MPSMADSWVNDHCDTNCGVDKPIALYMGKNASHVGQKITIEEPKSMSPQIYIQKSKIFIDASKISIKHN